MHHVKAFTAWLCLALPGSFISISCCFASSPGHMAGAMENKVTSYMTDFLSESAGPHRDRMAQWCPWKRSFRTLLIPHHAGWSVSRTLAQDLDTLEYL